MILRKAAFVFFFLCLLLTGSAQLTKGSLMTGGSLGFQFSTDHENHVNTATFDFEPLFGGFVTKNFVLGVAPIMYYTSSSGQFDSPTVHIHTSTLSLGLGPYARYYFKIAPKIYVFINGSPSIMANWNVYSADAHSPVQRTISANWVLGPGLSVMLTKSVALEVGLYYHGMYHRSAQFVNGNLLGEAGKPYVDNGMVLNVGFQVYLEKNKKEAQTPQ